MKTGKVKYLVAKSDGVKINSAGQTAGERKQEAIGCSSKQKQ